MSTASASPAPSERAHRSIATWLTGAGATAITSLVGFVATPLLLAWLGDPAWGAWTVVAEWLGYLGLTQFAFGPAGVSVFLLRAATSPQPRDLTAMARRCLQFYLVAAWVLLPVAVALAWWAPVWLHPPAGLLAPLRCAVAAVAVANVALTPALLLRGVLESVQRGYLVRAALLLQSLLITGCSLLLVAHGWGLVGMAAATVLGLLVSAGLWWTWSRPWLAEWRRTRPAPLTWGQLWQVNWPLLVTIAGNQINVFTDNTVVGIVLGPAAVAGFALTQTLPLLAGTHLSDVGGVSWAALGDLRARNDGTLGARIVELAATVLGLGIAALAAVAVITPGLVRMWVGAAHFQGYFLTWATAGAMVAYGFVSFFRWLIDTQGDTRHRMLASAIGSALNLALSLLLIRTWGTAGVALGTMLAYLATDAWFMPRLAVRRYGVPGGDLIRALVGAAGRGALWACVAAYVAWRLPPVVTWFGLMAETALFGLATLGYCWWFVLRAQDRQLWWLRWQALRARTGA